VSALQWCEGWLGYWVFWLLINCYKRLKIVVCLASACVGLLVGTAILARPHFLL
jgi:hypothetical protein